MKTAQKTNLIGRAILAVSLTVGFYGLALAIASGLLFIVYAQFAYVGRINLRLTLFSLLGAAVILWAVFPRLDRFKAPGPSLTSGQAPELFAKIGEIAQATGQSVPEEVFLVPDVNAFVAERGGTAGIGRRKVMGIGLPLLHLVNVDELRAILAHELGHFYGGDTSLGPWIYRTRAAMIRTVVGLRQASNRLLQIPFELYARTFLRITNAISRQQEYSADRLAARIVGKKAAVSSLQSTNRYGPAFRAFLQQEFLPALNASVLPPMMDGFKSFISVPRIAAAVQSSFELQLAEGKTEEYDTHPSVRERISALQDMPEGSLTDSRPATVLIAGIPDAERIVLESMIADKANLVALKAVGWEEMTDKVYLPQWEQTVSTCSLALANLKPGDIPAIAEQNTDFFRDLCATGEILPPDVSASMISDEGRHRIVAGVLGRALAVALRREGWAALTGPGKDPVLVDGEKRIEPFQVYTNLVNRDLSPEAWRATCETLGISGLNLA